MADFFAGGVQAGKTSRSVWFILRSNIDATEVIGKVAADMTASYWRQGGTRTAITLSDLAAVNSAYSAGGVKEVDATNEPGLYRLDLPDAAIATGADWVLVSVKVANAYVVHMPLPLDVVTGTIATAAALVSSIKTTVEALPSAASVATAVWAAGTRTLTSFGTLVSDTASAVWSAGSRSLTNVAAIVTAIFSESLAGYTTDGTAGKLITTAGAAADPLLNAVPGAYGAGTAGFVLGNLADNTVDIAAIKAKTDQLTFTIPNVVDASGSGPTASVIAAAVLDAIVETAGNITLKQAQSILLAATAGQTADQGLTRKTPDGTATRIVAARNTAGEHTSVVLTPSA